MVNSAICATVLQQSGVRRYVSEPINLSSGLQRAGTGRLRSSSASRLAASVNTPFDRPDPAVGRDLGEGTWAMRVQQTAELTRDIRGGKRRATPVFDWYCAALSASAATDASFENVAINPPG